MNSRIDGEVVVITGGASGIGLALARRLAVEGARTVVLADLGASRVAAAAATVPNGVGVGVELDVTDEAAVTRCAATTVARFGPIGFYASNAGTAAGAGLGDDEAWNRAFALHVMATVYAARAVLPAMVRRGRGHFLVTSSAAGLLTEMDLAPYTATKHAAVALAEWLAIQHGDSGVTFSCLCPQAVRTPLLAAATGANPEASATLAAGVVVEPDEVADAVLDAFDEGRFLVLPHPAVAEYERRRVGDRDRWLAGMRKVRARLDEVRGRG